MRQPSFFFVPQEKWIKAETVSASDVTQPDWQIRSGEVFKQAQSSQP